MRIPKFTTVNKKTHPRDAPDDQLIDGQNIIFKDDKVKSRWGYTTLGSNLPLDGVVLGLAEYTKLRVSGEDLIAITDNTSYEYNETSGAWDEFASIYNTGTVGQIGSETPFTSSSCTYVSICELDSTHIAIAYSDVGDSYHGKAVIGTISNGSISFGGTYTFSGSTTTTSISICALTDSLIVIAYADASDNGQVIAGTISGSIITFNTGDTEEFFSNSVSGDSISINKYNSTTYFIAFGDGTSGYGRTRGGTVSGTVITQGATDIFNTGQTEHVSAKILGDVIAVSYYDYGNSDGKAIIGTISGTDIDFSGSNGYQFKNAICYPSLVFLDSTHIAVAYNTAIGPVYAKIGSVSGTAISFGSEYQAGDDTNTNLVSLTMIDSTHIAVAYKQNSVNLGKCILGSVSGTAISFGSEYQFDSIATPSTSIYNCAVSTLYLAIGYQDGGDSGYGKIFIYMTKSVVGSGTTWSTGWPENIYEIKFGTTEINGTGTPDTWFIVDEFIATTLLSLEDFINDSEFLSNSTDYIIRQTFQSTDDDYFDTCNIIEGLGASDEKQLILTNGVDPIKVYSVSGELATLDMTGDGGVAPIVTAKYCAYYHGHLMFGWCNDGDNDLPQTVYWSRRGYPTYWDSSLGQGAGYQDLIVNDDEITGMEFLKQRLWILKETSFVECYYTGLTDPAFEFIEDKILEKGCPYSRTVINVGESILYRSQNNICSFNGVSTPQDVGDLVIEYIKSIEDSDYSYKSFAAQIAKEFLYVLFIPTSATTWTPLALNYKTGSWTIWDFDDEFNTFGFYQDNIVFGDESGNVYLIDLTETDDNGANIVCNAVTKDYPLNEYKRAFMLIETILTTETNTGTLQISASLDFGDNYSDPVTINQNTADSIYEHVQNWFQRGEQVRFKIENVSGSQFAFESLEIDFRNAGRSVRR